MDGFKLGYEKAWDTMMPIMKEGIDKCKEKIKEDAVNETLKRLQPLLKDKK